MKKQISLTTALISGEELDEDLIESSGLTGFLDQQSSTLSGGQQQRLSILRSAAADAICNTISTTTDSKKMFEAVRTLNIPKAPSSIGVHNEQGCHIATDTGKAAVVAKVIDDEDVEGEDEDCDDDQN